METVYIETSIESLLLANPSRDVIIAGQQQVTRDWWQLRRDFIASTGFDVTAFQMFFLAGYAFVAALAFGLVTKRYQVVDYYRKVPA